MSTVKGPLKYLWTAVFDDGVEIKQPKNDHYSKHDKKAEGNPSAFLDVIDKQEKAKLLVFYLENVETGDKIGVDLETGQFAINGIAFDAHEQNLDVTDKELEIVYFREVRIDTEMAVMGWTEAGKKHYINRYFIGWQVKGMKDKALIAVN